MERGRRWGLHACHLAVIEGVGQSCMGGLGWHFLASPPTFSLRITLTFAGAKGGFSLALPKWQMLCSAQMIKYKPNVR